jgi:aspartyl-tRNA(Asn)/glutamyl-tRNA(Gln) amidotransferase subunit C
MSISREDVERVARLAHLDLGEEDAARMVETLGAILDYMAVLAGAPGEAPADPASGEAAPFRDDELRPGLAPGEAVAAAPQAAGTFFRVPPVLGGGDRP